MHLKGILRRAGQFLVILLISRKGQKHRMKRGLCSLEDAFFCLSLERELREVPFGRVRLRARFREEDPWDEGVRRRGEAFFFGLRLAIPEINGP